LSYQYAKSQGWSEDAARNYALASTFGGDIVYDTMLFSNEQFWAFAGTVAHNNVTTEHIDMLNDLLSDAPSLTPGFYDERRLDGLFNRGNLTWADSIDFLDP
jgi:hypothetical protein